MYRSKTTCNYSELKIKFIFVIKTKIFTFLPQKPKIDEQ